MPQTRLQDRKSAAPSRKTGNPTKLRSEASVLAGSKHDDDPSKEEKPRRVAVFGSSLNPCTGTGGHQGIVEYFRDEYDEVWVIPVYRHQFADKNTPEMVSFHHRVEMAKIGLLDQEKVPGRAPVKILEIEKDLVQSAEAVASPREVKIGTHAVLAALQERYSDPEIHPSGVEIHFVMGEDTFQDLCTGKWLKGEEILERYHIDVVNRSSGPDAQQQQQQQHQQQTPDTGEGSVDSIPPDSQGTLLLKPRHHRRRWIPGLTQISSTQVRTWIREGRMEEELEGKPERIHPKVLQYIQKEGLYGLASKQ